MSQKRAESFLEDESSMPKQSRLDETFPYSSRNELYSKAVNGNIDEKISASKYLSFLFHSTETTFQFQKKVAKMVLLRNLQHENETLQVESLVTIKNLAKDYSNVNVIEYLIGENELLKKLLKPLLSENVEICEQAISLVQELCENSVIIPYSKDYLQSKFIKINGHTAFLELLSSENCNIRFKAASFLNKIDSDIKISDVHKPEGPVFKTEKVFDANKISNLSAFFEYMKNPSHVLQHSACCCLNAFLSAIQGRSAFRKLFNELNTQINVSPLVALLSSPKIKVQKGAIILVDALVCAYSGNKKQFLQAGALRALALQLQYPKRRKLAAAGIHNFSKNVVQADVISTHRTESIQKIIKFLIQILRQKDSEAFACALIALKNFVLEPCYRDFCIHAGIFYPLIKAIQNEPPNQLFIHKLPRFLSKLYESGDSVLSNKKIVSTIPAMKTLLHVNDQDIIRASILAMWTLGKKFESRFVQCLGTFVTSQVLSLIDPNVNLEEKVKTLTKPLDQNIGMMLLIENTMDPQIQDWEYLPNVGQTVLDQFAIFLSDHYLELTQQCSTRNKIQNEETLCYLINNFDLPLFGIQKPINSLREIPYAILFNILFTTIVQLHVHPSAIKLAKEFMEKKNITTFDPKVLKNDILKEFASLTL